MIPALAQLRGFARSVLRARNLSTHMSPTSGPVENSIREKLTSLLKPSSITIINDSWKHRHHVAMRARGEENIAETRTDVMQCIEAVLTNALDFAIKIVSSAFENKTPMQRHRMIYSALSAELEAGLHALALETRTEREVQSKQETA